MSAIDLSYAARGESPASSEFTAMAMHVNGWTVGWACFEGADIKTVGHFHVRDHMAGEKVLPYRRALGAMRAVSRIAVDLKPQVIVAHIPGATGPLWDLPCAVSVMVGAVYKDMPNWPEHLSIGKKELTSWATVLMGKSPTDETETMAVALGTALIRSRELMGQPQLEAASV